MRTARTVGFQRMATHNGPGIRSTLFLKGCPLKCTWCHNPESQSGRPQLALIKDKCVNCGRCAEVCRFGAHTVTDCTHSLDRDKCTGCGECESACRSNALVFYGREMSVEEAMVEFRRDRVYYEASGGGITVSGGEPTMQIDFLVGLLKACRSEGFSTAVDTCGYAPRESFERIIPYTDIFLYDIKHIDSEAHRAYTGVSNELIISNLKYLDEVGCPVEIRIPCIPGVNMSPAVMDGIGSFLSPMKCIKAVRILRFNNYCGSKYDNIGMRFKADDVPVPTDDEMQAVRKQLESYGLKVIL